MGRFCSEPETWFLDKRDWHRIRRAEVSSVSGIFQAPYDAIHWPGRSPYEVRIYENLCRAGS
jgi:hypothetical protein